MVKYMAYYNTFNQILLFQRRRSKFKTVTLFRMYFQKILSTFFVYLLKSIGTFLEL